MKISLINVEHLFIVVTIFVLTVAPLYLKNWNTLATVFLFNNLQHKFKTRHLINNNAPTFAKPGDFQCLG